MFGIIGNDNDNSKGFAAQNFEALIGKTAHLTANLSTTGAVRIDGEFNGTIVSEDDVAVGETGVINANIFARNITVAGKIKGNIVAKGTLEILAGGEVRGDVSSESLSIEPGAIFRGSIRDQGDPNLPQLPR